MGLPAGSNDYKQWFETLDQSAQNILKDHHSTVHKHAKRQRSGPYSTPALDKQQAKELVDAVGAVSVVVRDACKDAAKDAVTAAASE